MKSEVKVELKQPDGDEDWYLIVGDNEIWLPESVATQLLPYIEPMTKRVLLGYAIGSALPGRVGTIENIHITAGGMAAHLTTGQVVPLKVDPDGRVEVTAR